MTRKQRRIFYFSLTLVFLVIAPLILFYAAGYNFSFTDKMFVRTGLLVFNSDPKGADIILESVFTKKRTPERISNLLPAEYDIEVKKSGYYGWQKKLNVLPNLTTFADDIVLFLKKPKSENLLNGDITESIISPNKKQTALLISKDDGQQIIILDALKKTQKTIISSFPGIITEMSWLEQNLIVKTKNNKKTDYIILNPEVDNQYQLSNISTLNFRSIKGSKDNIIFGLSGETIYRINLFSNTIEPITKNPVSDYILNNENIFYLSPKGKNINLISFDLADSKEQIIDQYDSIFNKLINLEKDHFILKGKNRFVYYSLENELFEISFDKKLDDAYISANRKILLYKSENEIWIYNFEEEEKELISRFSQNISQAFFLPGKDYVIYNLENTIYAVELDSRDIRNNHLIFKSKENIEITPLSDNKYLGLIIKKGSKLEPGYYTLKIR